MLTVLSSCVPSSSRRKYKIETFNVTFPSKFKSDESELARAKPLTVTLP